MIPKPKPIPIDIEADAAIVACFPIRNYRVTCKVEAPMRDVFTYHTVSVTAVTYGDACGQAMNFLRRGVTVTVLKCEVV